MTSSEISPYTLSKQALRIGGWITRHRQRLYRTIVIMVAFITLGIWANVVVRGFIWMSGRTETNMLWANFASPLLRTSIVHPDEIVTQNIAVVARDRHTIDIAWQFENTNNTWAASHLSFQLVVNGHQLDEEETTLAPLQQRRFAHTRIPWESAVLPSVRIEIRDTTWARKHVSLLPEESWDILETHITSLVGMSLPYLTECSVNIRNKSVYGFRNSIVVVELIDASGVVLAIDALTIQEIASGEDRRYTFRWPAQISLSASPRVGISSDIVDPTVLIRSLSPL